MSTIHYLKNNRATINTLRMLYSSKLLPTFVPSDLKLSQFVEDFDPNETELARRERHLQKVNTVLAGVTIICADEMIAGNLTGLLTSEFGDVGKRIRTVKDVLKLKTIRTHNIWIPFPLAISEYEYISDISVRSDIYICDTNLTGAFESELYIEDDTDYIDSTITLLPSTCKLTTPEPGTRCVITAVPPKNYYNFVGEYITLKKVKENGDILIDGKNKRQKNIGRVTLAPRDITNSIHTIVGRSHSTKIINLSGDTTLLNLYGYDAHIIL